jgi:hypothetical protein
MLAAVAYRFGEGAEAAGLSASAAGLDPREAGRLEENAAYHELEPLLHAIATDCHEQGCPLRLPARLLERWSRVHAREMARTAIIQHGALKALAALREAGIRAIPLKGFYLSSRYYERGDTRGFRDLDLLVEPSSLAALNATLLASGFEPAPLRPSFVPAPAYTVYSLPLGDSDVVMEIDIHVGMHWPREYESRTRFLPEDLWSEAFPEEIEGMPLWALSTEHLIVTTLLDVAVNHRYARLIKFRDVLEIARAAEVDWEKIAYWCRRWEVRSFVAPGLRLLAEISSGAFPPPGGPGSLLPTYAAMLLFARLLPAAALPGHRSRSFSLPNLVFFYLSDTGRERARGLLCLPQHALMGLRRA